MLRNCVEIQELIDRPTSNGDRSNPDWVKFSDEWANIQYKDGNESSGDRDSTLGKATIKIRYRPDISNKMRVVYEGRIFDIEDNYDIDGRWRYLMIVAVISNK